MKYDHFTMLPEKAFQPRNGRQGMTLEGGGGGGQTSTTYTSNIPEWLRPQTEALLGAATQEYFNTQLNPETGKYDITGIKGYKPFSEDKSAYFAPFSEQQRNVQGEVGGMTTSPLYGQAAGLTGTTAGTALGYGQQAAGMGGLYERMATDPTSMQGYMSPYMQNVVERQKLAAIEDAQRANLGANLASARQGTYGGARQALAQSQREAALGKQMGDIQAQGLQSAFEQAQKAQQFGVGAGLQGLQTGLQGLGVAGQMGAQLGNIATAQQQADVQRLGLQREIGAEQQAFNQAMINQAIQDYAMAQQYPYQQLAGYSGLLRGYATPTTTVSQYQAAQSPITQLTGTGIQLGGAAQAIGLGKREGGEIKSYAEGGITDTDAIEGMAEDLSIPQLQQSMQNKTVPQYVGIPILENKVNQAERMQMAQAGIAPDMGQQAPIADQVMQRANQLQGINEVQTAAGGGMVAFNDGGIARFQNRGAVQYDPNSPFNRMFPDPRRRVPMTEEEKEEARRLREMGILEGLGELTAPVRNKIGDYFSRLSGDISGGRRDLAAPAMNPMVPDEYPGIDFTDADIAKALGTTPAAAQARQAGPAGSAPARTAPMAGPGRQAAPAGIAPEVAPQTMAEQFKQREAEERALLGEDPRIKRMQENLKKQSEEPFLDRMMRGLQMVAAGEQLKQEGKTDQLEKAMANEAARREAIARRQEKQAELEGAEYQRKAGIFKEVAGERREEAKTKASQAFQEKLLNRKLEVEEKLAKMKPASASEYVGNLLRSKDPADREVGRILAGQGKTGEMTRSKAFELYHDPTQFELRKQYPTFEQFFAYASGGGGGGSQFKVLGKE